MKLLLDTHVLLAVAQDRPGAFGPKVETLLLDGANELYVSVASLWEIAIKHRLGKLEISPSLDEWPDLIATLGIAVIPVITSHVLAHLDPEPPTRDPFDRLLLAQCAVAGLLLVTIDRALVDHPFAVKGAG